MKKFPKIKFIIFVFLLILTSYGCNNSSGEAETSAVGEISFYYSSRNDIYNNVVRVHNPEPATMILLGSGFATMVYANKKRKKYKI